MVEPTEAEEEVRLRVPFLLVVFEGTLVRIGKVTPHLYLSRALVARADAGGRIEWQRTVRDDP